MPQVRSRLLGANLGVSPVTLMKTILLAIGGNSLIRAGEKGTMAEQLTTARRTAREIVGLIGDGFRGVLQRPVQRPGRGATGTDPVSP